MVTTRASRGLLALLALDLAGSAALTVARARGRGRSARLGGVAAIAVLGVGSAAPILVRAARRSTSRAIRVALATVAAGVIWNTVGATAVERATARRRGETPLAARLLLVLGDAVSVGYLV